MPRNPNNNTIMQCENAMQYHSPVSFTVGVGRVTRVFSSAEVLSAMSRGQQRSSTLLANQQQQPGSLRLCSELLVRTQTRKAPCKSQNSPTLVLSGVQRYRARAWKHKLARLHLDAHDALGRHMQWPLVAPS
jgi:hypothetical protein